MGWFDDNHWAGSAYDFGMGYMARAGYGCGYGAPRAAREFYRSNTGMSVRQKAAKKGANKKAAKKAAKSQKKGKAQRKQKKKKSGGGGDCPVCKTNSGSSKCIGLACGLCCVDLSCPKHGSKNKSKKAAAVGRKRKRDELPPVTRAKHGAVICPKCRVGTVITKTNRETGEPFASCSTFPACRYARDIVSRPSCPRCHVGKVIPRTNSLTFDTFFGCSTYPACAYTCRTLTPAPRRSTPAPPPPPPPRATVTRPKAKKARRTPSDIAADIAAKLAQVKKRPRKPQAAPAPPAAQAKAKTKTSGLTSTSSQGPEVVDLAAVMAAAPVPAAKMLRLKSSSSSSSSSSSCTAGKGSRCLAILKTKGTQCTAKSTAPGARFCGRHKAWATNGQAVLPSSESEDARYV